MTNHALGTSLLTLARNAIGGRQSTVLTGADFSDTALEALPDLARRGGAKARIRIASEAEVEREMAAAPTFQPSGSSTLCTWVWRSTISCGRGTPGLLAFE